MDINRGNMDAFFEELKVSFTEGFNSGNESSILNDVAMVMPSTGDAVNHAWLNQIPQMREWVGDRVVNNIQSNNMIIVNKLFEGTVEMKRTSLEDDQHGVYSPLVRLMGENAAVFPDSELANELVSDPTWLGDDATFFGTDRQYGDNTIANQVTTAFTSTTFETAMTTMASYKGQKDEPLNVQPFGLLHGPSLRDTVWDVLQNDMRATATTDGVSVQNRNKGRVTPYQSSRLVGTYASDWFLLGTMGGIKGIIWQDRDHAELQRQRWTADSEYAFVTDKFQVGTRSRGAAFLSLPHLIYGGLVSQA